MRLPRCGGAIDTGDTGVAQGAVGAEEWPTCGSGVRGGILWRGMHVDFERQMRYQQKEASRHSG